MHDVVAHSVSMMVVQAGGARRILDRDPERAVAAAELIERTGREALAEMRAAARRPARRRARRVRAAADAARARRAGRARARRRRARSTLEVDGRAARAARRARPRRLPRRAGGAHERGQAREAARRPRCPCTTVPTRWRSGSPIAAAAPRTRRLGGSGHGLVGMRERVRMYGGELHAGRRRGGGFEVRVRLPLEGEEDGGADRGGAGMSVVRVLIADDQALVRAGFKMILDAEDDLDVVGEASDGVEAVELARRLEARRRADGHPHAAARRDRGDAARVALDGAAAGARADAHHVRPQRVRLRGAARRRERLPAQGRPARAARRRASASSRRARRCSRPRSPSG